MKEGELLSGYGGAHRRSGPMNALLDKVPEGSCGAAVITKSCVVRHVGDGGSAVRTVERGALVQVWSCHSEVRLSVALDQTAELDRDNLICKFGDIALVPNRLWGALFPLKPDERIALAYDTALAERLALVDVGSVVQIVTSRNTLLGHAKVQYRNEIPGLPVGIYFGVKLLGSANEPELIKLISLLSRGTKAIPFDCDAVVTVQQIRPVNRDWDETPSYRSSLILDLDDTLTLMPKSVSHQTLRSVDEAGARRKASRSLDLTNKVRNGENALGTAKRDTRHLDLPLGKHSASRSLDLPPTSNHRLTRGRACASLDSDSPVSKSINSDKDVEDRIDDELGVGSLVELKLRGQPHYGVVRWVGHLPDVAQLVAGVEMEEELAIDEDNGTRGLFTCAPFKALFVPLSVCRRDSRFQDVGRQRAPQPLTFGKMECPVVEGTIPPISVELQKICGKNRGIQGHHNSCYLDATLFAMFAFTSVFDSLLYRPPTKSDIPQYADVQRVLRDEIVNPLRKNLYVRADRVMKLRTLLEQLSSVTGLTSEEKDPEEFLNSLLAQILKADPFLQLSSGQEAFHYQLFVEKDERLVVPSVQQLLEQSFLASDIKLKQLPPCLIVQMPRFGKAFKMYPRILPPTVLDVTDVIENSPRQCTVCGKLAELECRECYQTGLEGGSFCAGCLETAHSHPSRSRHVARPLAVPVEFRELQEHCAVPRLSMNLFAVVCIETSHYVAFLNTEKGWVFFDSMADRKGEQNGYNIPEIVLCPELPFWLSEEGARALGEMHDERNLPELAKRLLCDAYMCMYQSPDIIMYR